MSYTHTTVTLEMKDGEEIDVEVKFYIDPGQNGGWTDPSWDAYIEDWEISEEEYKRHNYPDEEIEESMEEYFDESSDIIWDSICSDMEDEYSEMMSERHSDRMYYNEL